MTLVSSTDIRLSKKDIAMSNPLPMEGLHSNYGVIQEICRNERNLWNDENNGIIDRMEVLFDNLSSPNVNPYLQIAGTGVSVLAGAATFVTLLPTPATFPLMLIMANSGVDWIKKSFDYLVDTSFREVAIGEANHCKSVLVEQINVALERITRVGEALDRSKSHCEQLSHKVEVLGPRIDSYRYFVAIDSCKILSALNWSHTVLDKLEWLDMTLGVDKERAKWITQMESFQSQLTQFVDERNSLSQQITDTCLAVRKGIQDLREELLRFDPNSLYSSVILERLDLASRLIEEFDAKGDDYASLSDFQKDHLKITRIMSLISFTNLSASYSEAYFRSCHLERIKKQWEERLSVERGSQEGEDELSTLASNVIEVMSQMLSRKSSEIDITWMDSAKSYVINGLYSSLIPWSRKVNFTKPFKVLNQKIHQFGENSTIDSDGLLRISHRVRVLQSVDAKILEGVRILGRYKWMESYFSSLSHSYVFRSIHSFQRKGRKLEALIGSFTRNEDVILKMIPEVQEKDRLIEEIRIVSAFYNSWQLVHQTFLNSKEQFVLKGYSGVIGPRDGRRYPFSISWVGNEFFVNVKPEPIL